MKITAIKQQVKDHDRYSIYVDEKYSFGLSGAGLIDSKLRVGAEISQDELVALKDTAKADKGYNRIIGLIARRPRSEWEVRDYLKRKEYESEFIDQIVERAIGRSYLNDEAFARSWVENRRLLKATSQRKLNQELKQKRVSQEVIDKVLSEDSENVNELAVLTALIERKRSRYPDRLKLMRYLASQGYGYDLIKEALNGDIDSH